MADKTKAKAKSKSKAKAKSAPVPIKELAKPVEPRRKTTDVPRFGGAIVIDIDGPEVQNFKTKYLTVRVSLKHVSNRFVEVDEEWEVDEYKLKGKRTFMFRRTMAEGKAAVS